MIRDSLSPCTTGGQLKAHMLFDVLMCIKTVSDLKTIRYRRIYLFIYFLSSLISLAGNQGHLSRVLTLVKIHENGSC